MTVARSSQTVVEVLLATDPQAMVTQTVLQVLVTLAEAPPEPDLTQPVVFIFSG